MLTKKDAELGKISTELELAKNTFQKLNTGSSTLDEILSISYAGTNGLGFTSSKSNVVSTNGKPFVRSTTVLHESSKASRPRRSYQCHFCLKIGHIHPFCEEWKK